MTLRPSAERRRWCAGEQGFLLLITDSTEEGHGIAETLDGLANLQGISSAGNQETHTRETLKDTSNGTGENAQALAGLIEAAEEHDDRTFVRRHPLFKGLRGAERGRFDPVRNDDGIAAVVLDQRSACLLGHRDAHSDAFHVQAHGRRGNRARDRPTEGRVECPHRGGVESIAAAIDTEGTTGSWTCTTSKSFSASQRRVRASAFGFTEILATDPLKGIDTDEPADVIHSGRSSEVDGVST